MFSRYIYKYMNQNNLWEEKNLIEQKKNLENNPTFVQKDIINETKKIVTENEWKDITIPKTSGIYKIINKVNGKYYVGSTKNFWFRWNKQHKRQLLENKHPNKKLQHDWNFYGKDNFEFSIVRNLHVVFLLIVEQSYLNVCKLHTDKNYNMTFDAVSPMLNKTHTSESKNKMSESHKNLWKNEIYRKKCSVSFKKKWRDADYIKKQKENHKIAWQNDELKQNQSLSQKRRYKNQDNTQIKKRKLSTEIKLKMSLISKERYEKNQNLKLQISNKLKKIWLCENYRSEQIRKRTGINNGNYDHKIYSFFNKNLNLKINCNRYDLIKEFNLCSFQMSRLINKKIKSHKGWVILS